MAPPSVYPGGALGSGPDTGWCAGAGGTGFTGLVKSGFSADGGSWVNSGAAA